MKIENGTIHPDTRIIRRFDELVPHGETPRMLEVEYFKRANPDLAENFAYPWRRHGAPGDGELVKGYWMMEVVGR